MEIVRHHHSNRMLVYRTKVKEDKAFKILCRLYPERTEEACEELWVNGIELKAVLDSVESEC